MNDCRRVHVQISERVRSSGTATTGKRYRLQSR